MNICFWRHVIASSVSIRKTPLAERGTSATGVSPLLKPGVYVQRCLLFCILLSVPALCARAQFSDLQTIEIGTLSTTHVVFATDLSYVDISKQEVIAAKVVDASKNMLALKAREAFDYVTTISALEANGTMHTFKVRYNPFPTQLVIDTRQDARNGNSSIVNTQIRPSSGSSVPAASQAAQPAEPGKSRNGVIAAPVVAAPSGDGRSVNVASDETSNFGKADAPTLEEIMKYPQQLYHLGDKSYNLEAYVTNLYVYSDLIYVVISVYNKSDIGYEAGDAQFTIENLDRKRQNLATDKSLWAKSSYGSLSCGPQGKTMVGYTIPKFTLLKNECLRIYIYEKKGTRNLLLTLTDKDVNYAVSPK